MSCNFKFYVNGVALEWAIPVVDSSITSDADFNWHAFITSVTESEDAEEILTKVLEEVDRYRTEVRNQIKSISQIDKFEAFTVLKRHLERIGVNTHIIDTELEMQSLGFPNNTTAGVKDGEIYILKSDKTTVATPMHEFLHLAFAVMKVNNFSQFESFMGKISGVAKIVEMFTALKQDPQYSNMLESDIKEEAFVRYMANVLENKQELTDDFNSIYDELSSILVPSLKDTFGITESSIDLIDFLSSPFADLTKQGSTLFVKASKISNGYAQHKADVVLYGRIMDRIKDLMDPEKTTGELLITKGECK